MQWNVGIDIGASGARMAVRGRGVAFAGSAAAASREGEAKPFLLGDEALALLGRAAGRAAVGFPVDGGQVVDEAALRAWFARLLRDVASAGLAHRPRVLIARSPAASPATMKALVALCMESGASGCSLIRSDLLAAVGAGCDPMRPEATLVGELGAGSMAVTLFSMGRAVACRALPWGMRRADGAVREALLSEYALSVGPGTAEELKLSVLSALGAARLEVDVRGLDLIHSLPRTRRVEAAKLKEAVRPVVEDFCRLVRVVTRLAPAELAADLAGGALALTGGGASLFGLDKLVAEATGLSVRLPEAPALAVARGLAEAVERPDRFESAAEGSATLMRS